MHGVQKRRASVCRTWIPGGLQGSGRGRGSTASHPLCTEVVEIGGAVSCPLEALGRQAFPNGSSVLILRTVSTDVRMSITTGLSAASWAARPSLCKLLQTIQSSLLLFKAVSDKVPPASSPLPLVCPRKAAPHTVFCNWVGQSKRCTSQPRVCLSPPQQA